jgi:transposase
VKPWQQQMWCLPSASAEFVAAMEHILDVYEQPYNPKRPKVCLDESSKQLIKQTQLPTQPGRLRRVDYEYQRNGTRNLFLFFEPLADWRHVEVTAHRTAQDFAHQLRWLVDVRYPDAECIELIVDNLNIHKLASLYQTFEPAEANRIARRVAFHYTPKHGSWLNMAEIEFSVLMRKLGTHVPDPATLKRKVVAIETARNDAHATVRWQFTAQDARIRLAQLYPSIPD